MDNNKNDEFIYELLNYTDIDENIDDLDLDEVTSKRIKAKINKKVKINKKIGKKVAVAIASSFIVANVVLVSVGGTEVYANVGKSIIEIFRQEVGDKSDYSKYSNETDLAYSDKGIKMTINEVVADGNEINLSYSLIAEGKLKDIVANPNILMARFSVDGESIGGYGGSGKMVSDNRYDGYLSIHDVGDSGDVFYLDMDSVFIDELQGDWNFRIEVDKTEITKKSKEYNIGKNIDLGNGTNFEIEKIKTTPLSISLEATAAIMDYRYFVVDDKGREIIGKGSSSDGNKAIMSFRSLIEEDTKNLTFIPYRIREDYKPNPNIYEMSNLPIEMSQGSMGKLTVNSVEWINDTTLKIKYEAEGIASVTQSTSLALVDENNDIVMNENRFNTQIDRKDNRNFEMIYDGLDKSKNYKLAVDDTDSFYEVKEDLKFTIDLK